MDFPSIKKNYFPFVKEINKTEILRTNEVVFSISILCALKFGARYNAMVKASEVRGFAITFFHCEKMRKQRDVSLQVSHPES